MRVNGKPARDYRFKNKPKKQISYSIDQEMRLAAHFAGYAWDVFQALPGTSEWVDPDNPTDDKASVLASFRMHNLTEAIAQDFDPKK